MYNNLVSLSHIPIDDGIVQAWDIPKIYPLFNLIHYNLHLWHPSNIFTYHIWRRQNFINK